MTLKIFELPTELCTGWFSTQLNLMILNTWLNSPLDDSEFSIRVTVLLVYLDLALDTQTSISPHNSLTYTQIPLYYCKPFYDDHFNYWPISVYSTKQFAFHRFDDVILRFCVITSRSVFAIPFKSQKSTSMMVTPSAHQVSTNNLPCRRSRPLIFYQS